MAEYLPIDYEQRCSDRLNSQPSGHSVLTIVATQNDGTTPLSNLGAVLSHHSTGIY